MPRKLLLAALVLSTHLIASSQSIGINTDGSLPHSSAMLDVKSLNKGLLIPRVALTGTNDAATISTPAPSLLVFNTATVAGAAAVSPGFYFWNGSAWLPIAANAAQPASTGWLLTGNSGTIDGTHFIGTTDTKPFNVRVNNKNAGKIDLGKQNTFWGYQAGNSATASSNTATGHHALFSTTLGGGNTAVGANTLNDNTTGMDNVAVGSQALFSNIANVGLVAIGHSALYNNTGPSNTAVGSGALYSNTSGSKNTANGFNALYTNTTAVDNTAMGYKALFSNTTGDDNTATGSEALLVNTLGSFNSAFGHKALVANTIGTNNTAHGYNALGKNIQGTYNTAIGTNALLANTFGSYNTGIGAGADVSNGFLNNSTAIGYNAVVNASNKIRLGNTAITVVEGQVAYSFPSDARFKYNIQHNVPGLEFITKLTPVTYYFDDEKLAVFERTGVVDNNIIRPASYNNGKQLHTGFLAQDVEKIADELGYKFDGVHAPENDRDHYSLAYTQFIMPLVRSVQQQQIMIEELASKIAQKKKNNAAKTRASLIEEQDKKISLQQEQIDQINAQLTALESTIRKLDKR